MSILAQIRNDAQQILTSGIASTPITFTTPPAISPTVSVTCNGLAVKHSTVIDPRSGLMVNGKTARVTISEAALVAAGYTVRNGNGKVALQNHLVSFIDSAGLTYNGVITMTYPDETIGTILCELGDKA